MLRLCFAGLVLLLLPLAAAQSSPYSAANHTQPNPAALPGSISDPTAIDPSAFASAPPTFVPNQANDAVSGTHPQGPVRISGGIMAGNLLHRVLPVYPPEVWTEHLSTWVVLAVTISKTGTVKDIKVVSGAPLVAAATMDAVRQWTYKPYLLNGQLVEVSTTITCESNLNAGPSTAPSQPPKLP